MTNVIDVVTRVGRVIVSCACCYSTRYFSINQNLQCCVLEDQIFSDTDVECIFAGHFCFFQFVTRTKTQSHEP